MGFDPSQYDLAEEDNGVEAPLHAPGGPALPGQQSGPAQTALPQGGHLLVSHVRYVTSSSHGSQHYESCQSSEVVPRSMTPLQVHHGRSLLHH